MLQLAARARAIVDLEAIAGFRALAVVDAGPHVVVEIEQGKVMIDAQRGARGASFVELKAERDARLLIQVELQERPWAVVSGVLYGANLFPSNVDACTWSEAWSVLDGTAFGTHYTAGGATLVRYEPGDPVQLQPLAIDASESVARHDGDGFLWGSVVQDNKRSPARFDATGTTHIDFFPVDAEYWVGRGNIRAGAAWIDGAPRAVRCAGSTYNTCVDVGPISATASEARAMDSAGRVYGCATLEGVQRAFVQEGSESSRLLSNPARGCISDVGPGDVLVGEAELFKGEAVGVVMGGPDEDLELVRVARAWGTRLLSATDTGFTGAVQDETGSYRGVWLEAIEAPDGVTYAQAPEVSDPHLEHACGHGEHGPFADLVASDDLDAAGVISRTHTSYRVSLTGADGVHRLRLTNSRAGRVTFHLGDLVGLRVRDPQGQPVTAVFADDTNRCPVLRAFVQFDLQEVGDYVLEIGPTTRDQATIVYERTWVTQP